MGMLRSDPDFKHPRGVSRTKQAMKDECDVNRIVSKFETTSMVTHINPAQGRFLDVSAVPDYRSALEQVRAADEYFLSLPATVRREFSNDPALFLDAVNDPASAAELLEDLGLLDRREPPLESGELEEGPPSPPAPAVTPDGS